jgi:hypothetical protein
MPLLSKRRILFSRIIIKQAHSEKMHDYYS